MFNGLQLTAAGSSLLTALLTGHTIRFTTIKMGDGPKPVDIINLTDLVSTKQTLLVARQSIVDLSTVLIGSNLMGYNVTEAFYWKEVGIFAQDITTGTAEVLFSYGYADNPSYIPIGGTVAEMLIDLNIKVGNSENVDITLDSSLIFVTQENIDDLQESIENDYNGKFTATNESIANHIANKLNPHTVTKAQVSLGSVENYGLATEAEAKAGTSAQKYMTPQRVRNALEGFGVISDGNVIIKVGGTQPAVQSGKTIIWIDTSS